MNLDFTTVRDAGGMKRLSPQANYMAVMTWRACLLCEAKMYYIGPIPPEALCADCSRFLPRTRTAYPWRPPPDPIVVPSEKRYWS